MTGDLENLPVVVWGTEQPSLIDMRAALREIDANLFELRGAPQLARAVGRVLFVLGFINAEMTRVATVRPDLPACALLDFAALRPHAAEAQALADEMARLGRLLLRV